jgi:peroxiredoxin
LESVGFSEVFDEFAKLDAVVYGASDDSLTDQLKFARKYSLRVPLFSDPNGRYRALLGNPDGEAPVARITYVVDAEGIVRAIHGVPRIAAEDHPRAALESLIGLQES